MNSFIVFTPETESPKALPPKQREIRIFLAGGITGCPDWQALAIAGLKKRFEAAVATTIIIYNPRRQKWAYEEKNAGAEEALKKQIFWEHQRLMVADIILFWFCEETVCPITLFELGKCCQKRKKNIVVGCHEKYSRKNDVIYQLHLVRPELKVTTNFDTLLDCVNEKVVFRMQ